MTAQNPALKFLEMRDRPPEEAKFFWNGGPVEVAERTWFASLLSGATGFETDEGLVLVDTGTVQFAPTLAAALREKTDAPVHTAIYTHGHVDHAFGLASFLVEGQDAPVVVGHESMQDRFDRYTQTSSHNVAINNRQFSGVPGGATMGGGEEIRWEAPSHPPTVTYRDHMALEVGGVTFELHHCRGETDDHTWVFCPDRGVLCPGDLIIWGVPNAGNPQKVQRYPWDWAAGLRSMAEKQPSSMAPGHGGPVVDDPALIQRILTETADFLEVIVARTIDALEHGSPPHVDVVRGVELPVSDSPWLQPVYDEAEFIVRNVVRYFGGWWTGRPSELKPALREDVAGQIAALVGGADVLIERARVLADEGDLRLACHLADYALEANPTDERVADRVAEIYERRAASETSLMAINIFRSAAAYASERRPFA